MSAITQGVLTKQIVHRKVYSKARMGKTLEPIIRELEKWGKQYLKVS
ncbi:hypothetical protein IMCC1989_316 [gamma proteobacterium IMCC1989]|nr:hypothetical protein IMCC1989_316 [gamma proteobacterium IMCC1989]